MNKFLVVCCVACLTVACGSKKNFSRSESSEDFLMNEQLYAELYRDTRLLEFLDVKIRQIETIDSSGNVRVETNVDVSKKTDRQDLDSIKITGNKQQTGEKVVSVETKEERAGVIGSWVWIVGFIAIISIALVVGVYLIKK